MAALDSPWLDSMSSFSYAQDEGAQSAHDPNPPTVAAFSPTTISGSSITSRQRSSIIVHRKSPLLVATPPPVTRALAYSHPFILPLNKLVGLLSWSTGDPWESFLLVAGFWALVLYGDAIILWAGPIIVVIGLMLGLYSRRYSPLSSTGLTGEKHSHKRATSEVSTRHHKSLDEIVETMRTFTTRCNILLEPLLEWTDFLSTQRTPTSATTRPALTALFLRILCVTPIWILLTLPPFYIITTRRVIMIFGTIILTYHSRPARVSRVILWRSLMVRRICSIITGLPFSIDGKARPKGSGSTHSHGRATDIATRRSSASGIRFTFILYENQRRWLGIGWTSSLFSYERAPWTDEHLNPTPPKDEFELPQVQGGTAQWRWVEGSEWKIEGADKGEDSKSSDGGGWIYYDNKWNDGRRQDGWGRYTRRRKWYRDAELVEIAPEENGPSSSAAEAGSSSATLTGGDGAGDDAETKSNAPSSASKARKRRWFSGSKGSNSNTSSSNLPQNDAPSSTATADSTPNASGKASSRPISFKGSFRNPSFNNVATSFGSNSSASGRSGGSLRRSGSGAGTAESNDSASIRKREIEESQNRLDRWGARATAATERAERELGLGDDANMGLS
ncbi:hypothetical protein DTO207G8_2848 [Paecilomyces variotii]|nr:hypothetical protein DTO169E5_8075 [Paecilomyces variotii]KAJ9255831.1 hypothetical protein DTO207G8_2848 [Paecilomyces variotii]KAJ9270360.1 hypothetical protein DTO212C5_3603 [Paecilomyces variotii]